MKLLVEREGCMNFDHVADDRYKMWVEWIQIIFRDVQNILQNRFVYNEVQSIIASNTNLHQASVFYDVLGRLYVDSISVAIRRQLDGADGSISIVRLLSDIKKNPQTLSRARYVALNTSAGYSDSKGHHEFDSVVGEGEQFIKVSVVEEEMQNLNNIGDLIKKYTTKRIAHRNKKLLEPPFMDRLPVMKDADDCLAEMERLVIRYLLLLKGDHYTKLVPTYLYDWKNIFRYSWIPESPHDEA